MMFPNTKQETVQFLLTLAQRVQEGTLVLVSAQHEPMGYPWRRYESPGRLSLNFAELVNLDEATARHSRAVWSRWKGTERAFPVDPRCRQ